MLTRLDAVGRLDAVDVFMFASLGEVDGKPITALLGRDKRRKAGVIPGLFYCFTSLLICQILVSSLFFVSLPFAQFNLSPVSLELLSEGLSI